MIRGKLISHKWDKINNLIDNGILEGFEWTNTRRRTSGNRFGFHVYRQKHFPRFAITPTQKQFNYLLNAKSWVVDTNELFVLAIDV
ncbi:MAG: hypothetical protein ACXW2E_01865 [Nitrososphaeraceae archaeon]